MYEEKLSNDNFSRLLRDHDKDDLAFLQTLLLQNQKDFEYAYMYVGLLLLPTAEDHIDTAKVFFSKIQNPKIDMLLRICH
jgi:hypothetical protein